MGSARSARRHPTTAPLGGTGPGADAQDASAPAAPHLRDHYARCRGQSARRADRHPQHLVDAMHRAWVEFAGTGKPGWGSWDSRRPVMRFDRPAPRRHPRRTILSFNCGCRTDASAVGARAPSAPRPLRTFAAQEHLRHHGRPQLAPPRYASTAGNGQPTVDGRAYVRFHFYPRVSPAHGLVECVRDVPAGRAAGSSPTAVPRHEDRVASLRPSRGPPGSENVSSGAMRGRSSVARRSIHRIGPPT
jgi:hypothetical protein